MAQERREIERLAFTFAKGGAAFVEIACDSMTCAIGTS